jgi:hypothetical protein
MEEEVPGGLRKSYHRMEFEIGRGQEHTLEDIELELDLTREG